MSNIVTNSVILYRKLQTVYEESIYESLEQPANKLTDLFKTLLDSKAEEYKLKKNNSVYDTKFYYIKNRVKSVESFYEKLIRKEIGIKLTTDLDLFSDMENSITNKKIHIVSSIKLLDDIIGLRIVTELKEDCLSVYNLILNSPDFFIDHKIELSNLSGQPEQMQNGLKIYRIKGTFQGLYGFELQIKSKINETWGDLDHVLFYKDYTISPIKDTVQITMNNVGTLLDEIEKLLYDLRQSGGNYDESSSIIQTQKGLEDELSSLLHANYGVRYNIKEYSHYLFHFRGYLEMGDSKLSELDFNHLQINPVNELQVKYTEIRNSSLALTNLEGIYMNWSALKGKVVTAENVDSMIEDYINQLCSIVSVDLDISEFPYGEYMNSLILHKCSASIFLKTELHIEMISVFNRILDILNDSFDSETELPKRTGLLFSIYFFNGDYQGFMNKCIEEDILLNDCLILIKGQVTESSNMIDLKVNNILNGLLENII